MRINQLYNRIGGYIVVSVHRLREVLYAYKEIIPVEEDNYEKFVVHASQLYSLIMEKEESKILNSEHRAFACTVVALYKCFVDEYKIEEEVAIELIHVLTFKATERILEDMSFVQVAYYLMCNKPYLRQLIFKSLSQFNDTDMEDHLEEYQLDQVLESELKDTNINEFFKKMDVPELCAIDDKIDAILEEFVDVHFTKRQKKFTLEDIF